MAAALCSGHICYPEAAAIFVILSECNERRDLQARMLRCHPEAVKPLVGLLLFVKQISGRQAFRICCP